MPCTDCPTCGERLHAMGDEEREARFAPHKDYMCHNEDCDDCGEMFSQRQVDDARDSKAEEAYERRQQRLLEDPGMSYEELHHRERLQKDGR